MNVFRPVLFRELNWHSRVTVAHYYSALVSDTWSRDAAELKTRIYPHIREVHVEEWRVLPSSVASTEGVPSEGQLNSNFEPCIQDGPDHHDGRENDDAPRKKRRPPVYNAAFSQRMQQAIENALPKSSGAWQEYCLYQKDFLERVNRMHHRTAGPGPRLRKRGVADIGQGRGEKGQGKRSKQGKGTKRAREDFGGDRVLQLRDRILKHGLPSSHYVQIENSKNERWYMRVTNGNVLRKDTEDPVLASALWCETGNVAKLSATFTTPQEVEIRSIIAAGPMSQFR
jgi:hypothetical protein